MTSTFAAGAGRIRLAFIALAVALTVTACGGGGGEADQRPQLPAPYPPGERDVTPSAEESSSSLYILQRATSGSASDFAVSESSRYVLSREELPR